MRALWEKIVALAGSNLGLKVLALVIAVGLWIAGHRDIERAFEVALEFRNIPGDLMVLDNRLDYVVLRLMGPRTLISTLDADDLKRPLDLTGAKSGAMTYPLNVGSFNLPRGVTVSRITPPVLHLRLEPALKRTLPVSVRVAGKPAAGYRVARTAAQPEMVSVTGPADEVRRLTAIETLPLDVDDSRGVRNRRVWLSTGGKPLSFAPEYVEVSVILEEEESTRTFDAVQVRARDFEGTYTVSPQTVFLKIAGPKSLLDKLELKGDEVYLNLKGLAAGDHNLPLTVELPSGVRVDEQKPQRFKVRINKSGK